MDLPKIGRIFVGKLGRKEDVLAKLVGVMIGFAPTMGIRTVTMRVKMAEQNTSLHEMAHEQTQGSYFLEPISPTWRPDFATAAEAWRR